MVEQSKTGANRVLMDEARLVRGMNVPSRGDGTAAGAAVASALASDLT
jgi:hypothetical protein